MTRVLFVESGSRHLVEKVMASFRSVYGDALEIDLVTCYLGARAGFTGRVWRVTDYEGGADRERLWQEIAARDYPIAGILCAAEPIMTKWKWWLAAKLRAKIFIINENADFFWCDWSHFGVVWNFALERAGLTGAAAVPALARLLFLPVTVSFLLAYAGTVHLRRRLRLL